ncbi:MAG: AraC family transcriptional regulator [Lachnospiraceae bacterium]|nr:AraC family transcriptional regulator [Lachnospiraceae bacterium]
MYPLYEATKQNVSILDKISTHVSPHLHYAVEFVYIIEGTLELGVEREFYHMEKGDFGMIFPNQIHHYQVFSEGVNRACYILASPALCTPFTEDLQKYCPKIPVISQNFVDADIINIVNSLREAKQRDGITERAYLQILLAKSMPFFAMTERCCGRDLVEQTVSYLSMHFKEEITLQKMALDLGVSTYILSRVFSGTFHRNFNRYLNEIRLDYACALLEHTNQSITEICMESGFGSQRTFNRVFREYYRVTPKAYRDQKREKFIARVSAEKSKESAILSAPQQEHNKED